MLLDLNAGGLPESLTCDVCVVGGGAVGLALATSLAQAGQDVIVLEGGGATLELDSQALQRGHAVGRPFPNIDVGRYRVLGGTTLFWGGQVLPFDAHVLGARPWLGQAGWPVSHAALAPYFPRAFELLGLRDAHTEDAPVWRHVGMPAPDFGPEFQLVMTRWLKMRNFARLFERQIQSPLGPRVVTHANVTQLQLDPSRRRVLGVQSHSLDGRRLSVSARRFVLATGALEIARQLLHPLSDGTPPPWADLPHLGRPLLDHLDCVAAEVDVVNHHAFRESFDHVFANGHKYHPKLRLAPRVQREEGLLDIVASFGYRTRLSEHLEYIKMFLRSVREGGKGVAWRALPRHVAAVAATSLPLAVRYLKDRRSFKPRDAEVSLGFTCEQLPTLDSRLTLGDDLDPLGLRRLRVDWRVDGREMLTMRRFGLLLQQGLERADLARVRLDPRLLDLDPAFLDVVHDGVHQMGTTRMGRDAGEGVVDESLRVFGTDNLHVAGAAVFPSSGFANPTFTAIALALRLSDHLVAGAA